jgi:hypothetical protein
MRYLRHEILSDKAEWHFFELPKIPIPENSKNTLEQWLSLINAETDDDIMQIENLKNPQIQTVLGEVKQMNHDDEFVNNAVKREERLFEEMSALKAAKREGLKRELKQRLKQ